jgi:hypothetical protein
LNRRCYTEVLHHADDQDAHPDQKPDVRVLLDPQEGASGAANLGRQDRGNERKAGIRIGAVNAEIEAEWARLRAGGLPGPGPDQELEPAPFKLTHQDLHALAALAHLEIRDAWIKDPPTGFRKVRLSSRDEESLREDAEEWLEKGGYDASIENIERLKPLLLRARNEAAKDVERARTGDYQLSPDLLGVPRPPLPSTSSGRSRNSP